MQHFLIELWMNMSAALVNPVSRFLRLSWLTGPLLDKELRVSSRRRRNYILRSLYVIALTVFVTMVWLSVVKYGATGAYQRSRMAVAGKTITSTIVMFQFLATQLIAIVMLSTAISDEIYHRTLGLLMTTPISSFQIVMGKLFSKLLQLILLLAISLPLLAIIRVLGGVPWNYVLSSLCITLTAVIFAGTLSMYFSISNRRAYAVIVKTAFILALLYVFIPTAVMALSRPWLWNISLPKLGPLMSAFMLCNPFTILSVNTSMMMSPRAAAAMPFFHWPLHCGIMLGASALLLTWSVKVVRKTALRQATGQLDFVSRRRQRRKRNSPRAGRQSGKQQEATGPTSARGQPTGAGIRRVTGLPVLWKELRAPTIQGPDRKNGIIGLSATIVALLITYGICSNTRCLDANSTHILYTLLFILIGLIMTMVLSATSITSEKESRSWPILLATSMNDWQILLGKALAVLRRCLPIWLLLASHVVVFVLARYIHPIVMVHLFMLVAWLVVFVTGSGLYFSASFKRTTSAVVASFALALLLWAIIPMLLGLVTIITRDKNPAEACMWANPVVQAVVIVGGACGRYSAGAGLSGLEYYTFYGGDMLQVGPVTVILLVTAIVYIFVGFLFAWRAKRRFRRNIF